MGHDRATAGRRRATAWVKDEPFGVEFAEIGIAEHHMTASGVAIGTGPVPYRLDYELETTKGFVTVRLRATSRGEGWRRSLDLRRDADGSWTVAADEEGHLELAPAGGDPASLAGALDCDLGLSPVTNMMPILRHGLLDGGGPIDFTMAWVAVPALGSSRMASATGTSVRRQITASSATRQSTAVSPPTSSSTSTPLWSTIPPSRGGSPTRLPPNSSER